MQKGKTRALLALLTAGIAALLLGACGDDGNSTTGEPPEKHRIVIIHSYDGDYRWTAGQNEGIIAGLARAGLMEGEDYELRVFFMDTRVNFTTEEQIQTRADIGIQTVEEFEPDVVFLTDDIATEQVGLAYLAQHPYTVVSFIFSGVNGDPGTYPVVDSLEKPGGQLTGTLERIPFMPAFEAAARILNPISTTVLFADDSPSSATVINNFRESLSEDGIGYDLRPVDAIQISTFEEWKQKVAEYQDSADSIALLTYHRVKDESGNIVPAADVIAWTTENSSIPVFGLLSDWSADGLVMSFGNSGYMTGLYVGLRGAEVLNGSAVVSDMPILDPEQVEITFNTDTAEKTGVTISAEDLLEAAEVYP